MDTNTILGLSILAGFISLLVVIGLQHRTNSNLAGALTDAVKQFSGNTQALDLLEPLATKVVPVSLVNQANSGAEFLKTLTPDQWDEFISALQDVLKKVTDGQPNTIPDGRG